jgi:hypothetical protein
MQGVFASVAIVSYAKKGMLFIKSFSISENFIFLSKIISFN